MLHAVNCIGERHMLGGEGKLFLADIRGAGESVPALCAEPVSMVYIDPPMPGVPTGAYRRGGRKLAGEPLSYEGCMALVREAVALAYAILGDSGTVFLHADPSMGADCRAELDRVFGRDAFVNEVVWVYRTGGRSVNSFSKKHDSVYMYRKTPEAYFNIEAVGTPRGAKRRNHMKREVGPDGRVFYSIRMKGREYRYYEDDPVYPSDVWNDIDPVDTRDAERTGYLEQRPEALLRRMILASVPEGGAVCDLFCGSGTCAHAAASLGRRFISLDSSPAALAVARKRLISRALRLPLYEHTSPLEVVYASPMGAENAPELSDIFEESHSSGRLTLTMKPHTSLYYAARGTVEGGVFIPSDYLLLMRPGDRVALTPGECLHIVDAELKQGFYEYSE